MQINEWHLNGAAVRVPHAWGEDIDLRWEGPAAYRTTLVPAAPGWLVFHGVSARAKVTVNGALVADHLGIWDAFSVRLELPIGEPADVVVEVTKNGGPSIPVDSIASGFLPFVFGTFGGIYRPVEWVECDADPLTPMPPADLRTVFENGKLYVDGKPTYLRGLLHWGWYPALRHPYPDVELCRQEIGTIAAMGFNCVKFCLWTPPHHYLELLETAGMFAWMELPVWNPSADIAQIRSEVGRIVTQYRHHKSIVLWTAGCEVGNQIAREDRRSLFEVVKETTGGALVKDSSGGAEMYGGDPAEFGDFDDFHPYCDLSEYPAVLDTLEGGPRNMNSILLGECNDFDTVRNLVRIAKEGPYWASKDPFLNAKGVRWQYDLPDIVANPPKLARHLLESSNSMKLFVHRTFQEWIRARDFAGSVITGIVDTPISTSGFIDDWGAPKFEPETVRRFMGADTFFLIPNRSLPWVEGGNRVGLWDPWHVFEGPNRLRIGMHSESGFHGEIHWQIAGENFSIAGSVIAAVSPLKGTEVAEIIWDAPANQGLTLTVNGQEWPIETVSRPAEPLPPLSRPHATISAPAFREAAYDFRHPTLREFFEGNWHTLLQVLPPLFCDPATLPEGADILAMRIDTRTFQELPLVVRVNGETMTTLRTGAQPAEVMVHRALLSL